MMMLCSRLKFGIRRRSTTFTYNWTGSFFPNHNRERWTSSETVRPSADRTFNVESGTSVCATTEPGVSGDQAPGCSRSCGRRAIEAVGFVAVWVVLGYALPVSSESYLLLGVPLTVWFQLFVRRRPLRELWVHDKATTTFGGRGILLAGTLALTPAYFGFQALDSGSWSLVGWWLAALVGAGSAAFAVRSSSIPAVLRSAAVPTAIGAGAMALGLGGIHLVDAAPVDLLALVGTVAKYLAVYFPLTFILEEVTFRGALDSHVHRSGEPRGLLSAVLVSVLWGLWHLPVAGGLSVPLLVPELIAWHTLVGVPLSLAWRRSGNLGGPGLAHAAIDAVRNGLLLGL
jgi:membrane protease YdiL (CAAX protease family)